MRLKDINVEKEVAAIVADAGEEIPGLKETLQNAKEGNYSTVHTPQQIALRQARKQLGVSQSTFAKMIHTPVATLRDWEQGRYAPSGAVVMRSQIVVDHPEIVEEYA